jgi:putative transcriptional regulator
MPTAASMVSHSPLARVFEDRLTLIPTFREEDGEDRYKVIGMVDRKFWTAVHVRRGETVRFISSGEATVHRAALDRAHMGRRIRRLRNRLGLTQEGFAERYGIPLSAIRQYEIARTMPPPAVRAYLTVIEREPEMAARALHPDAA